VLVWLDGSSFCQISKKDSVKRDWGIGVLFRVILSRGVVRWGDVNAPTGVMGCCWGIVLFVEDEEEEEEEEIEETKEGEGDREVVV
jgi:hypothetical protein